MIEVDDSSCCIMKPPDWMCNKDQIKRHFTVMAGKKKHCEVLTLSLDDLEKISVEFFEAYREIFDKVHKRLQRSLKIKMAAIKHCKMHLQMNSISEQSSSDMFHSSNNPSIIDSSFMRQVHNSDQEENRGRKFDDNSLEHEHHLRPISLYHIDQENSSFFSSDSCQSSDSCTFEKNFNINEGSKRSPQKRHSDSDRKGAKTQAVPENNIVLKDRRRKSMFERKISSIYQDDTTIPNDLTKYNLRHMATSFTANVTKHRHREQSLAYFRYNERQNGPAQQDQEQQQQESNEILLKVKSQFQSMVNQQADTVHGAKLSTTLQQTLKKQLQSQMQKNQDTKSNEFQRQNKRVFSSSLKYPNNLKNENQGAQNISQMLAQNLQLKYQSISAPSQQNQVTLLNQFQQSAPELKFSNQDTLLRDSINSDNSSQNMMPQILQQMELLQSMQSKHQERLTCLSTEICSFKTDFDNMRDQIKGIKGFMSNVLQKNHQSKESKDLNISLVNENNVA